jgi:hypothetical protein
MSWEVIGQVLMGCYWCPMTLKADREECNEEPDTEIDVGRYAFELIRQLEEDNGQVRRP